MLPSVNFLGGWSDHYRQTYKTESVDGAMNNCTFSTTLSKLYKVERMYFFFSA
jgi:hypothetical protein